MTRIPSSRIRFLLLLTALAPFLALASGCRVPLKMPAIQMNGPVPTIDWARVKEFAEASGAAYDLPAVIEAAYGKQKVVVRDLPDVDVRYFIYYDDADKIQTLSVRGTNNQANAISDIDSIKILDPKLGIFLHLGFKLAADRVYADATPLLHPGYTTRLTGHSLGGAIAAILMLDLIKDGLPVDQVITFGQPKITNEAGGKNAPPSYFRVINDTDVVPQLPPSTIVYDLAGPAEHFGPEITLTKDHSFTYSPVHIPRDLLADDLWKTIHPADVADHQIKNYIDRISQLK